MFPPASADAQSGSDAQANRLETITVTAQKVEENLQDVPISVTMLGGETLDTLKGGGRDVRFLSARAPSVIAESSFGRTFPRFYIRGIGNIDFDLNSSQPVSLVYDGVPYENPILKGYPVFDLAGIEVLRGPQGTLFGRNSPGGIIKFDSRKPTDVFDAYARAAYGTDNLVDLEGGVGGPVHDALSVRFSGIYQRRDGRVDNGFTGETDAFEDFEEFAGRAQFLFTPFDTDFSALLNLHGRSNEGSSRVFRANIIDQGAQGLGETFDRDRVFFDGGAGNRLDQEAWGVTLTLEKSLGTAFDLTYILGYETADVASRGDIDGGVISETDFSGRGVPGDKFFPFDGVNDGFSFPGFIPFASETAGSVDDLDQTTHELRLAYDAGGRLRGQTGLFVFEESVDITSLSFDTLAPDQPVNGIATRSQDTDALGLFASLEYDLTARLELAGGLRYSDDDKDFVAARTLGPFGSGTVGPLRESVGDEEISWDVSATYAVSSDINVYTRIAKGFRAPSVQGRLVFGDTLSSAESETVLSYEGGVKSELFNGRVRANANAFFYELNDQQLTIVGGTDNTVALFNADEGEGYGFEADLEALVTDRLRLSAGLSLNKTEIKDDLLIAPGCGAPCTILDPAVFERPDGGLTQVAPGDPAPEDATFLGYNISGNSFPNAPEWIANVTARYSQPMPGGELYAFTDWAFKGETNFFLYESVEFGQDGFWEGGLRLGYAAERGYDVAVFARNILDKDALTGGIDFNNLTGFVNEPRTVGVELSWSR